MITLFALFCYVHEVGPDFAWPWLFIAVFADAMYVNLHGGLGS